MRRLLAVAAMTAAIASPAGAQAPKAGGACPKASWGATSGRLVCVQTGASKYVWGAVPTAAAATPATTPATVAAAQGPRDSIPEGTHLVGVDVRPGVYRATPTGSGNCYADTQDRAGKILEQEVGKGSVIIRVDAAAFSVTNSSCGVMTRIGD